MQGGAQDIGGIRHKRVHGLGQRPKYHHGVPACVARPEPSDPYPPAESKSPFTLGTVKQIAVLFTCLQVTDFNQRSLCDPLQTVVNELKTISMVPGNAQPQHDAKLGLMVLNVLVNSSTCRIQM